MQATALKQSGKQWAIVVAMLWLLACGGCKSTGALAGDPFAPSNDRNWQPLLAVMPTAEVRDDTLRVKNIRNCYYITEHVYTPRFYDATYDLRELQSVDYIVVPFQEAPSLAHTMLSFGFKDGRYLCISAEARLEEGEVYSPLKGALRQYELMYVVADERDLIQLRTEHRGADVYVYRTTVSGDKARALLVDMMQRANQLAKQPEFYDTITNNCTSNIVWHVNRVAPGRVPYDLGVLLPGHSARLAYDQGLLDRSLPFEELKERARVNELAHRYRDHADFSELIRR